MKKIVALFGKNKEEILEEAKKTKGYEVDLLEIRADYLEDLDPESIESIILALRDLSKAQIILTLRTKREGGRYDQLDYATRLQSFLDTTPDYIDLQINELTDQSMQEMIHYAGINNIKTILSVHHMSRGVSMGIFHHYLDKAQKMGADIVKVVDYPKTRQEVIFKLILSGQYDKKASGPELISISMGDLGQISRTETNLYKPKYTFINISEEVNVGQIRIEEMEEKLAKKTIINFYTTMQTSLGKLYIYTGPEGINEISFDKARTKSGVTDIQYEDALLREAVLQLLEYLTKERKEFKLRLDIQASDFEKAIYEKLIQLPYGQTISYKELAASIGKPDAARAVGNAMAKNKLPVIIPCHRVIKSDGGLGEYTGGIYRKQILIALELESDLYDETRNTDSNYS